MLQENVGEDSAGFRETFSMGTTEKRTKNGRKRVYCVFTSSLLHVYLFLAPIRHLELSTDKGTKNARETADIVRGSDTSDRKIFGEMTGM